MEVKAITTNKKSETTLPNTSINTLHRAPKAHAIYVNHVLRRGLPLKSMHAEQLPENELLPLEAFNIRSKINLKGNTKEEDNQLASVLKSITLIKSNTYSNECLLKVSTSLYNMVVIYCSYYL
ncbi:unnamed protein product [Trichobilharzia regenti]|nr:unnamed protein product [Trichobilharzia regenti]